MLFFICVPWVQSASLNIQTPYFKSYSVEDGLSQITVYEFTEDKFGFVWMATQNGIDRFDGYEFKHYGRAQEDQSLGLMGSVVHSIAADPITGNIWAGSINGLSQLIVATGRFQHYELINLNGTDHVMRRLYFDKKDQLWVATDSGVFRYMRQSDSFEPVAEISSVLPPVYDLVMDDNGVLWMATGQGLMAVAPGKELVVYEQLSGFEINSVSLDNAQNLWVGTSGQGVYKLYVKDYKQPQILWQISYEDGLADAIVKDVRQLQGGEVWVATNNGLVIFPEASSKQFKVINIESHPDVNLADNTLSSLFQTRAGVVWVGSWTNGFSVFDPHSIKFSKLVLGGKPDTFSVEVDHRGHVWVVNEAGLWQLDNELHVLGHYGFSPTSWESKTLHKISGIEYSNGTNELWLATRLGLGRYRLGDKHIENVGLKGKSLYTVAEDQQGKIWIGTFNEGLFRFDPAQMQVTGHWDLPLVPKIDISEPGSIWAASIKGVYRIDRESGELQHFTHNPDNPASISHNVVTWISSAGDGKYWVATQAGGLNLMTVAGSKQEDVSFQVVAKNTKLDKVSIGAVAEDSDGSLWITTIDGIIHYQPTSGKLQHFDGRNGSNSSGYYIGSYAEAADGRIFFTGAEGLTYFYPSDIVISDFQPKVFITDINVLNKPLLARHLPEGKGAISNSLFIDAIVLNNTDLILSADFTALDYSAPKHNMYALRLLGFDSRWQVMDAKNRTGTFTNLDPGEYLLQVKGSNKDGVWSPHFAELQVQVFPPWWRTNWALTLWFLMFFGTLIGLYQYRTRQIKQNARQLKVLVEERTAELEKAIKQLTLLSGLDPLTGVSNRRDFSAKATQEFNRFAREDSVFCILMLDIDHFKQCNDTFGHAAGDHVLQTLANILTANIRANDIIARWGGEEFILLLPDTDLERASTVAHKIQYSVSQSSINFEGNKLDITLTIGIAQIRHDELLEDCIRRADNALYRGKEKGRDCIELED